MNARMAEAGQTAAIQHHFFLRKSESVQRCAGSLRPSGDAMPDRPQVQASRLTILRR
jgi:hypothetical protein